MSDKTLRKAIDELRKWLIKKLGGYVTQNVCKATVFNEPQRTVPLYASIDVSHDMLADVLHHDEERFQKYINEMLFSQLEEQISPYVEIESREWFDRPARRYIAKIIVVDPAISCSAFMDK